MSYRHPLWLATQRLSGRRLVRLEDEATRLKFLCQRGADRMFGEIFHTCLYDVPACPVRRGDLVIDVGANHGFASCYFAHRGADVVAFEPSPTVFPLLQENIAGNRLQERVRAVHAAVSDRDGKAALCEAPELGGARTTISREFASTSGASYRDEVEVECRSIASALADVTPRRVRLLKLDCEGSELPILAALAAEERARIDSIVLEFHSNAYPLPQLVELLLSWEGFHVSKGFSPGIGNDILHLVSDSALRAWGQGSA